MIREPSKAIVFPHGIVTQKTERLQTILADVAIKNKMTLCLKSINSDPIVCNYFAFAIAEREQKLRLTVHVQFVSSSK